MRHLFFAALAFSLGTNAGAEECVAAKTTTHEGGSYGYETCVGRVEEIIKTTADGYVSLNYIVQYQGQRLVVSDPLARSQHAVGDQMSFVVSKLEEVASSRSPGFRALSATTVPGSQRAGVER